MISVKFIALYYYNSEGEKDDCSFYSKLSSNGASEVDSVRCETLSRATLPRIPCAVEGCLGVSASSSMKFSNV